MIFLECEMAGDDDFLEDRGDRALVDLRETLRRAREARGDSSIARLHTEQVRVSELLLNLADNQDDRINFRINSVIKQEFERLCKVRKSTLSREIKRMMVQAIRRQSLS